MNIPNICTCYESGLTCKQVAEKFSTNTSTVRRILIRNKVRRRKSGGNRKHLIDQHFFDEIKTASQAWVLGLIMADGYVSAHKITLCSKDYELLVKVKTILKSGHKIGKSITKDKRTKKFYTGYSLQVCSQKLSNGIQKLGIKQRKSFTCPFPKIPDKLIPHMIRGIFDGDGSICFSKNKWGTKDPRFSLIGSKKVVKAIKTFFVQNGLSKTKLAFICRNRIAILAYGGRLNMLKIRDFIYNDSTNETRLSRKFERFMEIKR